MLLGCCSTPASSCMHIQRVHISRVNLMRRQQLTVRLLSPATTLMKMLQALWSCSCSPVLSQHAPAVAWCLWQQVERTAPRVCMTHNSL